MLELLAQALGQKSKEGRQMMNTLRSRSPGSQFAPPMMGGGGSTLDSILRDAFGKPAMSEQQQMLNDQWPMK